ncbi:GIY-YIG nuclease family protein [Eggerthella sinensis]|uniref:GIY-YIG nuclease family protein n=1 Tax=Eggerthella sinensis TaxID=242230 RepID=UPI001D072BED|nr:GIY-YIG nuclease family protein [Eggerthella sinensis]MCB7037937.1 GIY-YIG nuclease family protein [Eggerthella sinensis]
MQAPGSDSSSFFLYVLECADGTWYTGYTVDVDERVRAHNAGAGAKYTRSRRPVRLLVQATFATKHEAMSAEYRFKRLSRRQKERLVRRAAREPFEHVLRAIMPSAPARADKGEAPSAEDDEGGAVA